MEMSQSSDVLEVENFLLRSKLASHEETFILMTKEVEALRQKLETVKSNESLQSYKTELKEKEDVIANFINQIARAKNSEKASETLQKELEDKENQLKKLNQLVFEATEKVKQLEVENFLLASKLQSHEAKFFEMKKQSQAEQSKIDALIEEQTDKNEALMGIQSQLQEKREKITNLEKQISSLKESKNMKEAENQAFCESIHKILSEKKADVNNLENQVMHLGQKLAEKTETEESLKVEVFLLHSKLTSHESHFAKLNTLLKKEQLMRWELEGQKQKEIGHLQKELEQSQQKLQSQMDAFLTQEINALKTKDAMIDELNVKNFVLENKLFSHQMAFKDLEEISQSHEAKIESLTEKVVKKDAEFDVIKHELNDKKVAISDLEFQLKAAANTEKEKNQLEAQLESCESNFNQVNNLFEEGKKRYSLLEKSLFEKTEEMKQLRAAFSCKKEDLDSKKATIDELKVNVLLLQSKLFSYEKGHSEMQEIFKVDKRKIKCLSDQNASLLSLFDKEKSSHKAEIEKLQRELDNSAAKQDFISNLENELNSKMAKIEQLEIEKFDFEAALGNLKNEQVSKLAEIQHLNNELGEMKAKIIELENKVLLGNEQIETLNLKATESETIIGTLLGRVEDKEAEMESKLSQKDAELKAMNCKLQDSESQFIEKISENLTLATQLAELETINEETKAQLLKEEKTFKDTLAKLQADLDMKENLKKELETKLLEAEESLESQILDKFAAEEELETLKRDSEQNLTSLQEEIRKIKEDKAKLEADFTTSLDFLEKDLEQKTLQSDEYENQMKELISESENLKSDLTQAKSKIEQLAKEKEAKNCRIKLLLGNQKRSEKEFADLMEQVERAKKKLVEKEKAEKEVVRLTSKLHEMEEAAKESDVMPWEVDPELKDLTPMELKSILGKDLSNKEKNKLNEMCVQELEKELKAKVSAETALHWEITALKKELQKSQIKMDQQKTPPAKLVNSIKKDKRKMIDSPANENAKKPKRQPINGQENENVKQITRRRTRNSIIQLDKAMPDNPFNKKSSTLIHKRPLETITNQN